MLLVLAVGVLEMGMGWGSRVVLGQGSSWSDLGGEVPTKPWTDVV